MEYKTLEAKSAIVNSIGGMSYSESVQAWNTVRLKKEIINNFEALKKKSSKFAYVATLYRTHEELEKAVKKIIREKRPIPLLLLFQEVKES